MEAVTDEPSNIMYQEGIRCDNIPTVQ